MVGYGSKILMVLKAGLKDPAFLLDKLLGI